jgi:acyl-CoA synthetase (AMP-forming)/AMP-acid ligase II
MSKTPLLNDFDLSSLKIIFSGAAHLTKEVEDQVKARLSQVSIMQGYGMSETTYGVTGSYYEALKPGTVGTVRKGIYVKIVDKNGKSLPANKVGELCFKGTHIMKGYLNNPKATAAMIDKNGWLHTGDLGYYDDDQQFFIVDRLKELIKYKAFQVPPAELEGLLLSNPKIKDCGVIGIPDEAVGELPFAFVVKQPNVELSEDEVKNFVKENASNAKWLRGGVKFIEEIPKNPSGKILRRELRDLYKSTKAKL